MNSSLHGRTEKDNQRNLERFTPLLYQLKKSGESISGNHSMKCDIIGQEVGAYPYPKEDRESGNGLNDNTIKEEKLPPFLPKKLL